MKYPSKHNIVLRIYHCMQKRLQSQLERYAKLHEQILWEHRPGMYACVLDFYKKGQSIFDVTLFFETEEELKQYQQASKTAITCSMLLAPEGSHRYQNEHPNITYRRLEDTLYECPINDQTPLVKGEITRLDGEIAQFVQCPDCYYKAWHRPSIEDQASHATKELARKYDGKPKTGQRRQVQ